jgi:2-dehydro-3-deoxyglucarate aldolase/4-hydroxy-2-oxoheptanedioate aldolase
MERHRSAPGVPQVLKAAGCEFALFDMEHAGLGFETLKMLAAGCRGIGIEPLARVPRSEYHFMARALDVLWLGHFDLTNFLGIPGEFDSPTYLEAVRTIVAAARRHGKGLGFMAADAGWARRYRDFGFNMIAAGLDQTLLQSAIRATLAPLQEQR